MQLPLTFRDVLAAEKRPLVGLWAVTGDPIAAEIIAGSGCDLVLIDSEHGPIGLDRLTPLLHAVAAYPTTPLVRVPWNEPVAIKQYLDAGAQNLIVPMVSSASDARRAVAATQYPASRAGADDPTAADRSGRDAEQLLARGIGSALARASRWGRVSDYISLASDQLSLTVQIETAAGAANAAEIAAVEGVDAVFIGPADLAGSLGYPGDSDAPEVVQTVTGVIETVKRAGTPVGINAFDPAFADRWIATGADFVFVGADVTILARGSEALVDRLRGTNRDTDSY